MASLYDGPDHVRDLLSRGQVHTAFEELQSLAREAHDMQSASQVSQLLDALPHQDGMCKQVRIVILRNFTIEPVVPLLRTGLLPRGFCAEVQVADFNQFEQYILDATNYVPEKQPDLLVIAARLEDMAPDLIHRCLVLGINEINDAVREITERIEGWIRGYRSRSRSKILIHNFTAPPYLSLSIFDAQSDWGQGRVIRRLNAELASICRRYSEVYLLDFKRLQAQVGISRFFDERLWHLARQPLSRLALQSLAELYARFVCAMFTPRRKCLVLDLDNTLWGGILGEDSVHGIQLGPEYPGSVFMDFQRAILSLYDRGIILAINSKNNEDDVKDVLTNHPHMILRTRHFATIKVNWQLKPENMRQIATDLNIGLDSLVFLDDSPHECELMRQVMPEILTVQLPPDPLGYVRTLDNVWEFDTPAYSEEDRLRGQEYQAQVKRKELKRSSRSLEEFYRSLQMEVTILSADDSTVPRIAQLTQKTNQFNLTTRRYSETDIWSVVQSPAYEVYCLRVKDRFGDSGIVGVGILHFQGDTGYIDTLLLSCRVIGRHIEDALLGHLASRARSRSMEFLVGEYIPTPKNGQVVNFYERFGFVRRVDQVDRKLWSVDLSSFHVRVPSWIELPAPMLEKQQ